MRFHSGPAAFLFAVLLSTGAAAGPTAKEICKKMIAEGRNGGMTPEDCLCMHRVAENVLDDDVKALMFDSWLNGTNNMAALEALPRRGRVTRQMQKMQKTVEKDCFTP